MSRHLPKPVVAIAAALGTALVLFLSLTLYPGMESATHAAEPPPFVQAAERGTLRVAVIHVTPAAAPGAKVRTPDRLDIPVVQALAKKLNVKAQLVQMTPEQAKAALADGTVDLGLYSLPASPAKIAGVTQVPTSYQTFPKAVIRSDTKLRTHADMKDHSVCLAATATEAAQAASQAGAMVFTFPVPSDALVAVREGKCDLGLIDQTVWQNLMTFPEWKKFSATIELPDDPSTLTWLLADDKPQEAKWLRARMREWDESDQWAAFRKKWATDVAFDVYLDQEVPDCHS